METEGSEATEKNTFTLRSSFKKHKIVENNTIKLADEPVENKVISSIYCHRDENGVLIKHNPGKRNVVFSDKPVEIGLAAPRTFSRNYLKSNQKKKKSIQSEGFYKFNPEVIQRLDNTDDFPKLSRKKKQAVQAESDSVENPISKQEILTNAHEQIKITYFKPPLAGSWAPSYATKEGSDGESISDDSSEEKVYIVGQAERDEEVLNILSNGLDDEDDKKDTFFNDGTILKETNIDDEIFSAKMAKVIENASPKKYKETSLCENIPNSIDDKESSSDTSSGSLDSGIHEAGTDSPIDENVPKPMVITPKLTDKVADSEQQPSSPQLIPQPIDSPVEDDDSGDTESTSAESETSSLNSDDLRPPSPEGHEMTYLQYDQEPMLPKYKRDLSPENSKHEASSAVDDSTSAFIKASTVSIQQNLLEKLIPQTSLENFFNTLENPNLNQSNPQPVQHSDIFLKQQKEQQKLKEIQKQKEFEEKRLLAIQQEQEKEQLKLLELQRKQEEQKVLELQRLQEEQWQKIKFQQDQRRQQEIIESQRQEEQKMLEKLRHEDMIKKQIEYEKLEEETKQKELDITIKKANEEKEARKKKLEIQIQHEHELHRLRQLEAENKMKQIEVEKQKQIEQHKIQIQKPILTQDEPDGLIQDFDDIDNLLMGLLDNDPLIHKQQQQKKLQQIEAEVRWERQRAEEEVKRKHQEELIRQQEQAARVEELTKKRDTLEEEKRRKQAEMEEKRERKRRMREMSLEDVLKLQKTKKNVSPTLSIRSDNWSSGTMNKRSSSESLNSYTNTLNSYTLSNDKTGGNQMIAPLALLQEIINPNIVINDNYSTTDSFKSSTSDSSELEHRTVPVIVDNKVITSPPLPKRSVSPLPNYSKVDNISSRRDLPTKIDASSIPTKIETSPKITRPEPSAFNSAVEPYIVTATIEPYNSNKKAAPLSPNIVEHEEWLDIDDILADVRLLVDKPTHGSPVQQGSSNKSSGHLSRDNITSRSNASSPSLQTPNIPPNTILISPKSATSSCSSYNDVYENTPPPLPPKTSSIPSTPNMGNMPAPRTSLSPPISPNRTPPRSPNIPTKAAPSTTPPRSPMSPKQNSPSIPPRTDIPYSKSDTFSTSNTKSAFQNVNPHESSVRRRNSSDDLSKRAQQLSLQRNQQAYSSFRPTNRAQFYPEPQYGYSQEESNVTVPYYQPQRMYQDSTQRMYQDSTQRMYQDPAQRMYQDPAQRIYQHTSQSPHYPTAQPSYHPATRQSAPYLPPRQYMQPPSQQIYPSQGPSQRSPPKRQGSDKGSILNSRHHTVV